MIEARLVEMPARNRPAWPRSSAAGALTFELLELCTYSSDVAVERWLVTRTQAKVSAIRRDGRFAIADKPSQSTLFAQVGCVQDPPPPSSRSMRYWPAQERCQAVAEVVRGGQVGG